MIDGRRRLAAPIVTPPLAGLVLSSAACGGSDGGDSRAGVGAGFRREPGVAAEARLLSRALSLSHMAHGNGSEMTCSASTEANSCSRQRASGAGGGGRTGTGGSGSSVPSPHMRRNVLAAGLCPAGSMA